MDFLALSATLGLDTSEYEAGLSGARSSALSIGKSIGSGLVTAAKLATGALGATAGAIGFLTKESVSGFAEYEQLVGGVETLFSNLTGTVSAAPQVLEKANNAFRTAGMSASAYMETVTGFSAALVASLENDYDKAAKVSDMAITDMSDNANKMGSSMESIQNAYSGFAKQNYTMLDNLKLGYGGTKEEMERLLSDAEKFSGVKYNIDNLADVYEAIHVIQGEMGISGRTAEEAAAIIERTGRSEEEVFERLGTTAKEANETIGGSLNQLKASWENLITGLATGNGDIDTLVNNVIDSAETALGNLVPVIETSLSGIGTALSQIIPIALSEIPDLISTLLPDMGSTIVDLINSIMDVIQEGSPQLLELGSEWINQFFTGISNWITNSMGNIFSEFVGIGANLISQFGQGLVTGIPSIISKILPLVQSLSETIRTNAGTMVDVGIEFILNIAQGIINSLPTLLAQLPQIVINIAGVINDNAPKLLVAGVKLIAMIIKGVVDSIPALIENFPKIFEAILAVWSAMNWTSLGKNVINFIRNGIKSLATQVPNALRDIGKNAFEWLKAIQWSTLGADIIDLIQIGIQSLVSAVPEALKAIGETAVNAFKSIDWFDLGANIIRGVVSGISSNVGSIVDAAKSAARKAFDAAKSLLGIHSPSKLFRDEIGAMIPRGMALGIEDTSDKVDAAIERLNRDMFRGLDRTVEYSPTIETVTNGTFKPEASKTVTNTFNIQVDGAESPESYASRLMRELELQMRTA